MADFIKVAGASTSNKVKRSGVKFGQVFVAKTKDGKPTGVYAHTGTRTIPPSREVRYQSINLVTQEEASTPRGDKGVEIVGIYEIKVTFADEFRSLAKLLG